MAAPLTVEYSGQITGGVSGKKIAFFPHFGNRGYPDDRADSKIFSNWSAGVPVSTILAVIKAGTSDPVVPVAGAFVASLEPGLQDNGVPIFADDNGPIFNAGTSTVILNGTVRRSTGRYRSPG